MNIKEKREQYLFECEKCGRKGYHKFFEHASSKVANDYCSGKVRRIKWKNAW